MFFFSFGYLAKQAIAYFAGKLLIGLFRVGLNLVVKARSKGKAFVMKISFHSHANKSNFHKKSFALGLTFIVMFTATRKRPIVNQEK